MKTKAKAAFKYPVKNRRPGLEPKERTTLNEQQNEDAYPDKLGSNLELDCYRALLKLGWKPDDLQLQTSVNGGRMVYGGSVVDIIVVPINVAVSLKGAYWHNDPDDETLEDADLAERYARYVVIWDYEVPTFEMMLSVCEERIGRAI